MEPPQLPQTRCQNCSRLVPRHDIVSYGSTESGYRQLCSKCFHTEVAESGGLDQFEHLGFTPIEITDCDGDAHRAHVPISLLAAWPAASESTDPSPSD